MIDALQPFLEDKKQTLALDGGDDPVRLILAYFSTDNEIGRASCRERV